MRECPEREEKEPSGREGVGGREGEDTGMQQMPEQYKKGFVTNEEAARYEYVSVYRTNGNARRSWHCRYRKRWWRRR